MFAYQATLNHFISYCYPNAVCLPSDAQKKYIITKILSGNCAESATLQSIVRNHFFKLSFAQRRLELVFKSHSIHFTSDDESITIAQNARQLPIQRQKCWYLKFWKINFNCIAFALSTDHNSLIQYRSVQMSALRSRSIVVYSLQFSELNEPKMMVYWWQTQCWKW